jgi:hypothetical protein
VLGFNPGMDRVYRALMPRVVVMKREVVLTARLEVEVEVEISDIEVGVSVSKNAAQLIIPYDDDDDTFTVIFAENRLVRITKG